jgi:hypothetical protein
LLWWAFDRTRDVLMKTKSECRPRKAIKIHRCITSKVLLPYRTACELGVGVKIGGVTEFVAYSYRVGGTLRLRACVYLMVVDRAIVGQ